MPMAQPASQAYVKPIQLDGNSLTLEEVEQVASFGRQAVLAEIAKAQLSTSRGIVERILAERKVVYGITTGFGKFKDVYIAPEDSLALQRNFLVSHAAG